MKEILFFLLLILSAFNVQSQDTLVLVDRVHTRDELSSFPDYWQGIYKTERGVTWEVTPKSINSISNLYMAFTKKELLNKEGYSIKNGLLYGFVEDDSIPVFERNDSVFFAYSHRKELFELAGDRNILAKNDEELVYYQRKKTTMGMEMIKFTLNKGTLQVHYMNTEKVIRNIEAFRPSPSLEEGEFTFYTIKNKRKNFEVLRQDQFFEVGMSLDFEEKLD